MKIAVYTIALNESQFVERWYNSAKDADYLLIADTGSTDDTVEKAKALGINVITVLVKPWRFDDARNAALAVLPGDIDYCISLDMDEILVDGWREELEKATATKPRYWYTWNFNEDGTPGLTFAGEHIHTRHGYRWTHPVHETIVPDRITETQETIGLQIHHKADKTKSRAQYLPLLAQSVTEDPSNDRNTFYYARELYFYNQYPEAIETFKKYLELPKATWKPERAAAMRYIAMMSTDLTEKEQWFHSAIREDPNRREAYVQLAEVMYSEGHWASCAWAAESAIRIEEKPTDYLCEAWAWNEVVYDYAAISNYNLYLQGKDKSEDEQGAFHKDYIKKAVLFGTKAVELNPNDDRLQVNLSYYLLEEHGGNNIQDSGSDQPK